MKYITLLGDGMADYPLPELNGKTPLQVADTPNMDFIASKGVNGLLKTVPDGMSAGSDVANLCILGYDPKKYYTGRGPLEAAAIGVKLDKGDIAFRCNLITEKNGAIFDYSAGHISTGESKQLIKYLNDELGTDKISFNLGISYRHLLVISGSEDVICVPPHDVVGGKVNDNLPTGEGSDLLRELMLSSKDLLESHEINKSRIENYKNQANMIWPWSQGRAPDMPLFEDLYGVNGAVVAAVHLIKGIGYYAGLDVVDVPGATGYLDTSYYNKGKHAIDALKDHDFVFVHVEAPDEAGHMGNIEEKIKAIESFDK
ncbi:MAG: cofactor-independent phosphoglycerate mutase, partial [Halobacteriota archaeon]|nr:cofactor-independent phosphoglycerate mutase [Halobacteriota archaeon]